MELTLQMFFTALDFTSIISHIHSWVLILLWRHLLVLSGAISPLISSSILGAYWSWEFIFQCPIFLPFHPVHGVFKARILQWFTIGEVDHVFSEPSTMTRPSQLALHGMSHSFIELDKTVAHVISLASFLWLCLHNQDCRRTCVHLLLQELQNYNLLLNNHRQENVGSHQKKIPHVQEQSRSPNKTVEGQNHF